MIIENRNIAYVTPDDLHLHKNCASHNNDLEITVWNIFSGLFLTNDDFYVNSHLWQMFGKKYTTMYFIKNKSWLPYLQGLLSITITCNNKFWQDACFHIHIIFINTIDVHLYFAKYQIVGVVNYPVMNVIKSMSTRQKLLSTIANFINVFHAEISFSFLLSNVMHFYA